MVGCVARENYSHCSLSLLGAQSSENFLTARDGLSYSWEHLSGMHEFMLMRHSRRILPELRDKSWTQESQLCDQKVELQVSPSDLQEVGRMVFANDQGFSLSCLFMSCNKMSKIWRSSSGGCLACTEPWVVFSTAYTECDGTCMEF